MTPPQEFKNMSCEEFQALLPELIGTGEDINLHPHIQTCDLCKALLADLEAIADAARQLFPTVEPPDDLWSGIEDRLKEQNGEREHEEASAEDKENEEEPPVDEAETAENKQEPSKA